MEAQLKEALSGLVDGRVYPLVSPDNPTFPFIVYQQIGGDAYIYLEQKLPQHRHARMQVIVWSETFPEAVALARKIEQNIVEKMSSSTPIGAFSALYNESLEIYGARQDFGIWYKD